MTKRRRDLPDDAPRPTQDELDEARHLGALTGVMPVFAEYLEGSAAARSPEVPAHLYEEAADPGDNWAYGPDGSRMWGRYGAAGLLALDRDRGVLLQHRAAWSHFGGTWGIPGGALNRGEDAHTAAMREAFEEAAVPPDALDLLFSRVVDLGFWRYTSLVAETTRTIEARITDEESAGLAWVAPSELDRLKLHPGFGSSWPVLRTQLGPRPLLVVDVANVMGAKPDGWWRDRAGAAARLIRDLARVATTGVDAALFDMDAAIVWPRLVFVIEGQAVTDAVLTESRHHRVSVVAASGAGDDCILDVISAAAIGAPEMPIVLASSDRELRARAAEFGATGIGGAEALRLIPDDD